MNDYGDMLDEMMGYLDTVRETGAVNMFGAAPWLADAYDLPIKEARVVLKHWMDTYGERHPQKEQHA
jgi:hypothetical protein